MGLSLSMGSYIREVNRGAAGRSSGHQSRRWRFFENPCGETVFEVFMAAQEGDAPAVRTLVWAGEWPTEPILHIVNECFRAALDQGNFSFLDPRPNFTSEAALKWRSSETVMEKYIAAINSPAAAAELSRHLDSIAPRDLAFGRFDVVDQNNRGTAFTIQETELPGTIEYTVSLEWPLEFSPGLVRWIIEHHADRQLTKSDSGVRQLQKLLNIEP